MIISVKPSYNFRVYVRFQGEDGLPVKSTKIGIDAADLRIPDFDLPTTLAAGRGLASLSWWQKAVSPLFRPGMTVKPRIIKDKCIACGACRDICPMQVITITSNGRRYAQIDDRGCIRCYCCHETCPQDAIELHRGLLYRIINT